MERQDFEMREAHRNWRLVRRMWRAVTADLESVPSSAQSASAAGCAASRSFWSWSGPDCVEGRGLAKPQAFLWDGSLKLVGGDRGRFSVLRHSRGAKINGSEVIMLFLAFQSRLVDCAMLHRSKRPVYQILFNPM